MVVEQLTVEQVETVEKPLREGALYVSERYHLAIHLCACGCGIETVTDIGKHGWQLSVDQGRPTLSPLIGNYGMPCRSHYWVLNGQIVWC